MTHQLSSSTTRSANNNPLDVGPADPDGMFSCQQCSSRVNSRVHLQVHIRRIHLGIRPFKCTYCPKRFFIVTHLREHTRQHTGERPFACSACPKAFISAKACAIHYERMHELLGTRTFKCPQCNPLDSTWMWSNFKTRRELHIHLREHHGGRNLSCPYCSERQTTPGHLSKHIKRWHADRHYSSCSACKRPNTVGSEIGSGVGERSCAESQVVGSGGSHLYECSNCEQVLASIASAFSVCVCGEQLERRCACKRPTRGRRLFGGGENDDAEWKEESSSPFVEWWFAATDVLDRGASELEEESASEDEGGICDNSDEEWQHVLAFCASVEEQKRIADPQQSY